MTLDPVSATRDPNATNTSAPAPAPTPTVVVDLRLVVADPVGFVADPRNWDAMEVAVADMAGPEVDAEDVTVNLTVVNSTRRRLRDTEERHLQETGEVNCEATISVEDTAAGNELKNTVEQLGADKIQAFAQEALTQAGSEVVVTVAATPTVDVQQAPTPRPPPAPGSGQASAAGVRWKAFSLAPFFAVSAWLLSNI